MPLAGAARPTPTFLATAAAFRAGLEDHHAIATELWVGFYTAGAGQPSLSWPEAVDGALCVGWSAAMSLDGFIAGPGGAVTVVPERGTL